MMTIGVFFKYSSILGSFQKEGIDRKESKFTPNTPRDFKHGARVKLTSILASLFKILKY